jgi:hypothetical protein
LRAERRGPSILVFYEKGYEHVCQSIQHVFTTHGKDSEVMLTELATRGYELLEAACQIHQPIAWYEKSPFLQHAHNPVDWYPGATKHSKSETRKPANLCQWYSTCHGVT